jgi:UDP-N-acetylmuramoyl-L-alanyl-D-glutamate--2,6-diaminopimelate ligase
MRLAELLGGAGLDPALADLDIAGISADSRAVEHGFAFFAIPGFAGDGLNFVADAKARGASVVIAQREASCDLPLIVVADARAALALAAARFYPRQSETIAAVTGTSGKTSVVAFLRQIWLSLGFESTPRARIMAR